MPYRLRTRHRPRIREFDSSTPDPEERNLPRGTVNAKLLEAILRHRHYVLRVENGVIRNLVNPLSDALEEIQGDIARLAAKDGALSDFQSLRMSRLREMETRIEGAMNLALQDTLNRAMSDFERVAAREAEIQGNLLRRHVPDGISLDLAGPDVQRLESIIQAPLGGKRWSRRLQETYGEATATMKRSLATTMTLGEGMDGAARRLREAHGTIGVRRSVVLARSEIQRIANETARETYRQNRSVIKGTKVVATLDDRTCLICAGRDGDVIGINESGVARPPYHAQCRCFEAPVTKTFEEMGIDAAEFPPSTRASMDGQVPATLDYPEWFENQPASFQRDVLGPGRLEKFKSGDLTIDAMAKDLRTLPIDELPERSLALGV